MNQSTHIRLNRSKLVKNLKKYASSVKCFCCVPAEGQKYMLKMIVDKIKINIHESYGITCRHNKRK
jgi:hypothetical protein